MTALAQQGSDDPVLPRLRRDLALHPGPRLRDGSPTWTIEDPIAGHYFRIGWAEAEMLTRWELGRARRVMSAINADTSLSLAEDDVTAFAAFLRTGQLIECDAAADSDQLARIARSRRQGWARWLLHNYLFMRLPLVRPDRFLSRALPWVRPLASPVMLVATLVALVVGLAMAARQWEVFLHTFLHFFTLPGAAAAGLTLVAVKVAHELGHAFVCKAFGCRVPTMGVALMVMWPVLYTDTTAAWRLDDRRKRLAIGAAGMATELAIAAWATLAWSFLPDGMARSAAFTLATTTWIMTLAVNLSPLMRFDGYFLLSDLLDVPNLQNRSFAQARWQMRKTLFGLDDSPGETFEPWLARTLLIYAYATWIYRLFLFLGIALLVYHFAFKLLGLALFAIELMVFIVQPIQREVMVWWKRRNEIRMNRNSLLTAAAGLTFLALLAVPWRSSVDAPALMRAERQAGLYMPVGGQVRQVAATAGQMVRQGQVLFQLSSPELEHALARLDREIAILGNQSRFQSRNERDAARQQVAWHELKAALRRRAALNGQLEQLRISAPFDGRVADLTTPLGAGEWLAQGEWLATVAGEDATRVEAFVAEYDLDRLQPGAQAWFIPEDLEHPRLRLRVDDIGGTAMRNLDAVPELASPYQGAIAANTERDHTLAPAQAVYRVLLSPQDPDGAPRQVLRGTVSIKADGASPLSLFWRVVLTTLTKETAF